MVAFFVIYLLTSIIGEYLKHYSLELCRFHLRKLILVQSQTAIAGSLQTIFFKVKDIVDNLPAISKGKIYYQTLAKNLKNLERNS